MTRGHRLEALEARQLLTAFADYVVESGQQFNFPNTPSVFNWGPTLFDNLNDGRIVMVTTQLDDPFDTTGDAEVFVETSLGSRTWQSLGDLTLASGGQWYAYGGAFLEVSPDGSRIAVGDNASGTQHVGVFATADLLSQGADVMSIDWYTVPHSEGAWYDNRYLALNRGDFSTSQVSLLDTDSPVGSPINTDIITGVGGASSGLAFDADGNIYIGNGYDTQPGGSEVGDVRQFLAADWQNAWSTTTPLDFEADGSLYASMLSASSLEFDNEGNLFIGGSDFFGGGDANFLGLVENPAQGSGIRMFDPDTTAVSFYQIDYNQVTGEVYANQPFPLVDPVDSTAVFVISAGVPTGTADIGGPYSGDEGTLIALSGAGSSGATLYEWDLDNDGQYDDAVGENVDFNATDNGVFTIGLRINGVGGPTDSTTVTVNNVAPTASISGTTAIYRGETVTFTLGATDASPVDQAGLFDFEIDWDGNGSVDQTLLGVPDGTTVMHAFPVLTASNTIQVRATDKDAATSGFSQITNTVTPHVLRDDGFGNIDLIWGGTDLLDSVYVLGGGATLSLFVQFEGLAYVNRLDLIGPGVTGKIILHGYGFSDVLIGEFATANAVEIHGGDGDDVIVGGFFGDFLYGEAGNDVILGGTQVVDGADEIYGGEGKDTLYGHWGADTLDGGAGEDLLMSDRYAFADLPQAVLTIGNEWKSGRPYSERVSNIRGITNTGVNIDVLSPNVTVADDGATDTLIGGLGELDWFFYDFDQDLLGDTIELGEEETDTNP